VPRGHSLTRPILYNIYKFFDSIVEKMISNGNWI
jgi:hypothetical protein